jgi:hypothetical protein
LNVNDPVDHFLASIAAGFAHTRELHLLERALVSGKPVVQQAAVADGGGEHVVKVVRDTAGEPADRLIYWAWRR